MNSPTHELNDAHARTGHRHGGPQGYLEANVRSASPARLRLMLLERSVEVCSILIEAWRDQPAGSNQWSLKLIEIIGELLSGIKGADSQREQTLCVQVADLYVFLLQHLIEAETTSDVASVEEIRTVLSIETETWRAVVAQETKVAGKAVASGQPDAPSVGLNLNV